MRLILAKLFRFLFKIPFFKKKFFGFHEHFFAPKNLFKGLVLTTKFKNNILLELHIEDWISENIYFLDEYEEAELEYIKNTLHEGDVFIDIGANIGIHSLVASKEVSSSGIVISFEPFTPNYQLLLKNISLNQVTNISAQHLAISNQKKNITIYYDKTESNLGMASVFAQNYTISETVNASTLDLFIDNSNIANIDFIKLDIEGGEYLALQGMSKILKTMSPKFLIEILDEMPNNNEQNIISFMRKYGYQRFFINDNGKLSENCTNSNRRNYVFIKKNNTL